MQNAVKFWLILSYFTDSSISKLLCNIIFILQFLYIPCHNLCFYQGMCIQDVLRDFGDGLIFPFFFVLFCPFGDVSVLSFLSFWGRFCLGHFSFFISIFSCSVSVLFLLFVFLLNYHSVVQIFSIKRVLVYLFFINDECDWSACSLS